MNKQILKIKRATHRSQLAYSSYCQNKLYFKALRIHKANQEVYDLLSKYIYKCDDAIIDVVSYIFHLEDGLNNSNFWTSMPKLEDEFVFVRFDDSSFFLEIF
jgi:hypothetical protein